MQTMLLYAYCRQLNKSFIVTKQMNVFKFNIIFILMSLEVMLNAAALAFVAAGAHWGQPDGQIIFMLILTVAAAEVAVGLGLVLQVQRRFKTLDMDSANRMRG